MIVSLQVLIHSDLIDYCIVYHVSFFFSPYLQDKVLLSPSMALLTESLSSFGMAILAPFMVIISDHLGRVLTIIITRCIGISVLVIMALIRYVCEDIFYPRKGKFITLSFPQLQLHIVEYKEIRC